jgi:hypothetical protein
MLHPRWDCARITKMGIGASDRRFLVHTANSNHCSWGITMRIAPFALFLLLASPAWACGEQAVIGGDFATGAGGWGEPDSQFKVSGAEATFTPEVGTQTARWNAGKSLSDFDACVTVAMPDSSEDSARGYAGIMFWVIDKDNFHQAVISRNGMVTIARKVGGKFLAVPPVSWKPTTAINLGPNAKNALRLTVEGQAVALRINDQEVARFRGQRPEAANYVGIVASSAPAAVDSWRVSDFKVSEAAHIVAAAQAAGDVPAGDATGAIGDVAAPAGCGAGRVLFEDKFVDHDPMWGAKDGEVKIAGGGAEFDPAPGTPTLRWNRAFVFGDLDACINVELAKPTTNPTASYAGLLFWVTDSRNYYQAVVAPNGYFTVARIVDGKVVAKRPVAWAKVAAVKTGPKQSNTLRVTAKGPEVQVQINGTNVASFRDEPPLGQTHIGLLASSAAGKNGDTWSISGLKVTAPQ